jgi:PAS domain S-box-containing protein
VSDLAVASAESAAAEGEPTRKDRGTIVQRRARLALATMLALLVALAGVAAFATDRLYSSAQDRYIKEAFPLRAYARDLVVQMLNKETAVRGYMITANPGSLQPYATALPAARADLAGLRRLTRRRPEIAHQVLNAAELVRSLDAYFQKQIALVRSGHKGQLKAQTNILDGLAQFGEFRATATALQVDANRIVADAEQSQHRTFWRTLVFVLVAGIAAVAIGAVLLARLPSRIGSLYRREEEARRAAERGDRAARSLGHVADAVILLDSEGMVGYWNPAAVANLGVAEHDALNRPIAEALPEIDALEQALARGGGSGLAPIFRAGSERWFRVSESRFSEGRVLVLRNVTGEEQLERARAEFLATASHELRTPLAAVYGAVRTLRRPDRAPDASLDDRLLTMIEQESERLRAIVEQILVASQLDRHELRLDRRACDVDELCESVLASARVHATAKHSLVLDAPGEHRVVECDPGRLRQVVANLLDNAIKYTPDGGRTELRIRDRRGSVAIEVADQGVGIPPEAQARVFEKFFRVDANMLAGVGGSGLGLYISRELVEQMGGTLSLRSQPGKGSTFTVELPRSA